MRWAAPLLAIAAICQSQTALPWGQRIAGVAVKLTVDAEHGVVRVAVENESPESIRLHKTAMSFIALWPDEDAVLINHPSNAEVLVLAHTTEIVEFNLAEMRVSGGFDPGIPLRQWLERQRCFAAAIQWNDRTAVSEKFCPPAG